MKKLFIKSIILLIVLFVGTATMFAITKNDISLNLNGISTQMTGPFSNINEYTEGSGKTFTMTGENLYVRGRLKNETSQKIELNASKILIAFVYQDSPYKSETYSESGNKLTTFNIEAYDYVDVTIKIPSNYRISGEKLSLYFVYAEGVGGYFSSGTYNVTNSAKKSALAASSQNEMTLNTTLSTAQNIHMEPIEVSRYYSSLYEDIMQYRPYTNKYYYMGYENLNVKFTVKNKTNGPLTLTSNKFTISYNGVTTYNILNITDESYKLLSTITIPANSTIKIIMHLGNEWYDNRENPDNPEYYQPVSLIAFYDGVKTDYMSYSYLFSRASLKSLSVTPSVVTSNVTVKSTDESSIKSVTIIGSMGNIVKTKSYNSNCTEANFDLSNCKNDIYYIQVEKTNGVETVKVIKKQ